MVYTRTIFRFVAFGAAVAAAVASQATGFSVLLAGGPLEPIDGCDFFTSAELIEKPQSNYRLYGPGQAHWGSAKLIWSPKSNVFDDQINEMLKGKNIRKNITINLHKSAHVAQYTLSDAWITSIGLPTCDKFANTPGGIELTYATTSPISMKQAPPSNPPRTKQKAWMCNNFRVNIDGMEQPASKVSKVDAFTIKQGIADLDGDGAPDYIISDLVLQLPRPDAAPLAEWFFGKKEPRDGYIDYLDQHGAIMHRLTFQIAPIAISDLDADGPVTLKCSHVGPVRWMAPEAIRQ